MKTKESWQAGRDYDDVEHDADRRRMYLNLVDDYNAVVKIVNAFERLANRLSDY